jgi:hypothetical protein
MPLKLLPLGDSPDRNLMKNAFVCSLVALALVATACSDKVDAGVSTPTPITPLKIEQVEKLRPYMINVKKVGDTVHLTSTIALATGQQLVQHRNTQTFIFDVWVDEKGGPVMPPKDGDVAALRRPTRLNGTWDTVCFGGCTPNTSGGDPCVMDGCMPLDDSCGCTPLDCRGCEVIECILGGGGAIAGTLVMR